MLVRVLVGQPSTEAALARLREDGRLLARLQHECVLRVEQTSGVGGNLALVHENFECVGLHHVVAALKGRGQGLPSRVAVEIASSVGIALEEVLKITDGPRRLFHAGTTPDEVLLDGVGRVKLAGVGVQHEGEELPAARPGYAAPEGAGGWQAATWMVGALLVDLLTGEPPGDPGTDEDSHEAMLRRTILKCLARSGDTPSDMIVQAVRQALAHEADVRGTPGAFGRTLRDMAVQVATPGLRAWAPGTIPEVQSSFTGRRVVTTISKQVPAEAKAPSPFQPLPVLAMVDSTFTEDPELTVADKPLAAFKTASTRPAPQRLGPSAAAAPKPIPGSGPAVTVAPPMLMQLPASGDDESELTVMGRPLALPAVERPAPDPLLPSLSRSLAPLGPAPVAGADRRAEYYDEPAAPPRSMNLGMLVGIAALILVGIGLVVARSGPSAPPPIADAVAVPTLADVVGTPAAPDLEAAPTPESPLAKAVPVPAKPFAAAKTTTEPATKPAPETEPATKPEPETEPATKPEPKPQAEPEAAAAVRIAPTAPTAAAAVPTPPPPVPVAPPIPAAPGAQPVVPFTVSFAAAEPGMSLEVKCLSGGGSGPAVVIADVSGGNCRVTGRSAAATVVTLVTVTGPRSYVCFAGGTRVCR